MVIWLKMEKITFCLVLLG